MTDLETRYATRNVPRYTSYPTAPHFSEAVTPTLYGNWLEDLAPEEPLSLYLHVPYCRELCHYCGCNTKATRQDAPVDAYAQTLLKEIDLVLKYLGKGRPVSHIHWGGGTPSMLSRDRFLEITAKLKQSFDLQENLEHAIELDPRTVTPYLAETLAMAGINRTSLGVQDFDPEVQKLIGRVQPFSVVSSAVAFLRHQGLERINFDLMYGLPGQTEETIRKTVQLTKGLSPTRVALFGYAHVPWFKKHQRLIDEDLLPNTQERIRLSDVSRSALVEAGYDAIGLDHFALPEDEMAVALKQGRLRRNFQGYTTDTAQTLVGFGPSSIGFLPSGYVQSTPETNEWSRCVEAGILPVKKGIAINDDDRCRADIIERIMTVYQVDLEDTARRFGLPISHFDDSMKALEPLMEDGLVVIDNNRVMVSDQGRRYVRVVAAAFDAYLAKQTAKHSVAV
ncbi:oxygen-independent coproporphyrinogen III oxidase [Rhodobacteraceae bacterium RKSG542]|uniref:oxygen-independent coproporphyrinogen III oxidase n=1 Tax=Pseudovibrio flavus TaxID=2529854 RepID=UPI0012BD5D26|nr:oxygen-independent coproporphyrinogen III oxidase [Pseudovibrio flavus]MTI18833.1 oxygen-independent coproporphyrinogen III oxidase [Pseudovibrio flavus]